VVCWFNPLVWLAARQMRRERERACDDRVLLHGAPASGYARDLLEIARSGMAPRRSAMAALALAHRTELEGRLVAILDERRRRAGVSPSAGTAMITMAAGFILPLATIRVVPTHRAAGVAARHTAPVIGTSAEISSGARTAGVRAADLSVASPVTRRSVTPAMIAIRDDLPAGGEAPVLALTPIIPPRAPFGHEGPASTLIAIARSAEAMTSDYEKAELLMEITAHLGARPDTAVLGAILHAAGTIHGDYEHRRVLSAALEVGVLPPAPLVALIRNARSISSDFEKASLLMQVGRSDALADDEVRRAYVEVARTITSSFELRRAMALVPER
jgi:hypothetical protein